VSLAKDHLTPNKSVRCPTCGKKFLPGAQGRPANGPAALPLPVAGPAAAVVPPATRSKAGLVGCLALVFGVLMLLGMAAAGGGVYCVMRGQPGSGQVVLWPGPTEPGPTQPEPTGRTPPPTTGRDKPVDPPGPTASPAPGPVILGEPVEVTLLDKGGSDEPAQAPATPRVLKGPKGNVTRVVYARDGTKLAAVYSEAGVVLWDVASQQPTTLLNQTLPSLVFFSADGKTLITGSREQAGTYDVASGRGLATFPGELVTASADGRVLVTKDRQYKLSVHDVSSGKAVLTPFESPSVNNGSHIALSPDGKTFAVAAGQDVRLFDVAAGKELPRFTATQSGGLVGLSFTDATHLLVGFDNNSSGVSSIALWDVGDRNGQPQLRQRADEPASRPVLSPDRKTVTLFNGGQLRLWDIPGWKLRASIPSSRGSESFSADNETIAAHDAHAGVADAAAGQVRKVVAGERTGNLGLDYKWSSFGLLPDGQVLALGTTDGAIHLRPVVGGGPGGVKEIASLPFPEKTTGVGGRRPALLRARRPVRGRARGH
jgi:WD40 repeat protein